MTWPGEKYLLRQMLAGTANRESFLTGTSPIREDPMNRTLTRAGSAHYDPRLAELSTLPASHARSSRPCARTL